MQPSEKRMFFPVRISNLKASKFNFLSDGNECRPRGILAYNTFTAAAVELSGPEVAVLNRAAEAGLLNTREILTALPEVDSLYSAGFLVEGDTDETQRLRDQSGYWKTNREHVDLTIAPTLECNFRCTYCGQKKAPVSFSETDLKLLDRFFAKVIDRGTRSVVVHWYGGEPTLRVPDILKTTEMLLARIERPEDRFRAEMFTNAWLLDEKMARELSQGCHIGTLMISLDGPEYIHNIRRGGSGVVGNLVETLDRIELGLRYFHVKTRIHCDLENVGRMGELLDELASRGFTRAAERYGHRLFVHFAKIYDFTEQCAHVRKTRIPHGQWGEIETDLLAQAQACGFSVDWLPRRSSGTYCMGQRENAFLIVPGGYVYTCFHQDLTDPEEASGRLDDERIARSTAGGMDASERAECANCLYLPICSGQCPNQNWSEIPCTHLRGTLGSRLSNLWRRETAIDAAQPGGL